MKSVVPKEGRSGPLVVVTVEYRIWGEEGPALTESQNLIYTDSPPTVPGEPASGSGPPPRPWNQDVTTDTVLMFRFSALTNNSHRIHYDHSYATGVEGYPGLVVQGPLTAMLLADLGRRNGVTGPARFSFRPVPFLLRRHPAPARGPRRRRGGPMDHGRILEARSVGRGGGALGLIRPWPLQATPEAAIPSRAYE